MDIQLLSKKYKVRKLDATDVDIIYHLCCKNDLFYKYHPPFVTKESILQDMEMLPPNKSCKDKYYVGFFENNVLVSILDLILGYPTDNTAYIGLLMINASYQNQGVGSAIIKDICEYLKQLELEKVRIGVDKDNPQSNYFWAKNGFSIVGETDYYIMELTLDR